MSCSVFLARMAKLVLPSRFFVAEWNRTKLQTKFPIIATEIPHYCKLVIEGA
jgi:hypothetical protein